MKKIFLLASLFAGLQSMAQPPKGDAKVGDTYGEKISTEKSISVNDLPAELKGKDEVITTIKGVVTDVCDKKGCWITLETDNNTKVFVKMKDYAFFVPVAAKGKTVVMNGTAKMKTTSVEELKHYAEDAKKSKAEIEAITKPEEEIRFMANGITVVSE